MVTRLSYCQFVSHWCCLLLHLDHIHLSHLHFSSNQLLKVKLLSVCVSLMLSSFQLQLDSHLLEVNLLSVWVVPDLTSHQNSLASSTWLTSTEGLPIVDLGGTGFDFTSTWFNITGFTFTWLNFTGFHFHLEHIYWRVSKLL
ncbi:unnamed protein product [Ambrosiozyma monospora]|uniref:Unnamed protein product n=1 Tax=Ambrosiozyma monospora TaxID=43982 RepID=A0ACB5SWB7_AMBMO|nr:unnamed protein product [Ambrosiozyma monospora]